MGWDEINDKAQSQYHEMTLTGENCLQGILVLRFEMGWRGKPIIIHPSCLRKKITSVERYLKVVSHIP